MIFKIVNFVCLMPPLFSNYLATYFSIQNLNNYAWDLLGKQIFKNVLIFFSKITSSYWRQVKGQGFCLNKKKMCRKYCWMFATFKWKLLPNFLKLNSWSIIIEYSLLSDTVRSMSWVSLVLVFRMQIQQEEMNSNFFSWHGLAGPIFSLYGYICNSAEFIWEVCLLLPETDIF